MPEEAWADYQFSVVLKSFYNQSICQHYFLLSKAQYDCLLSELTQRAACSLSKACCFFPPFCSTEHRWEE